MVVKAENSADLLDLVAQVYLYQRLEFVWLTGTGGKTPSPFWPWWKNSWWLTERKSEIKNVCVRGGNKNKEQGSLVQSYLRINLNNCGRHTILTPQHIQQTWEILPLPPLLSLPKCKKAFLQASIASICFSLQSMVAKANSSARVPEASWRWHWRSLTVCESWVWKTIFEIGHLEEMYFVVRAVTAGRQHCVSALWLHCSLCLKDGWVVILCLFPTLNKKAICPEP